MPLDPAKVGLAVQNGLSTVCATCTSYWEGRDKGLPEPQCAQEQPCASPLRGDSFSFYSGPLPTLEKWCFRCGSESDYSIVLTDATKRRVGVCSSHLDMLRSSEGVRLNQIAGVEGRDGFVSIARLFLPQPVTLRDLLMRGGVEGKT